MRKLVLPTVIVLACAGVGFAATTHVIKQGEKKFSEKKITVSVGDELQFVNEDKYVHNIHSTSDGYEFDLGAQQPGDTQSIAFDSPGKVKIRCAIHPKMKLTVTVE